MLYWISHKYHLFIYNTKPKLNISGVEVFEVQETAFWFPDLLKGYRTKSDIVLISSIVFMGRIGSQKKTHFHSNLGKPARITKIIMMKGEMLVAALSSNISNCNIFWSGKQSGREDEFNNCLEGFLPKYKKNGNNRYSN